MPDKYVALVHRTRDKLSQGIRRAYLVIDCTWLSDRFLRRMRPPEIWRVAAQYWPAYCY